MLNHIITSETLERIELAQKKLRSYLNKANEQADVIDSLLNQLDEPVKNIAPKVVDDSNQPEPTEVYEPTYIARTTQWKKSDYRPLRRNVVH